MREFSCLESKVFVGSLLESELPKLLLNEYSNSKIAIVVDENTKENCLPHLFTHFDGLENAEIIELPAGEENKSIDICISVWEVLTEMEFGRNDLIICLGGGMVCDMGGFIASVFKRGMNCMYIPTSLLAMADASVGGKTGVDLGPFKNQLGAFSFPSHVFMDVAFLETLPEKEKRNGLAEMLKHGLIADKKHFDVLLSLENYDFSNELIFNSVMIKANIVEDDPTEKDERKLLNFGHTIGHAIEGLFLNTNKQMDHGLAVAHGMIVETYLSFLTERISQVEMNEVCFQLKKLFPIQSLSTEEILACMEVMKQDKKQIEGKKQFSLLEEIGKGRYNCEVNDEIILQSFEILNK